MKMEELIVALGVYYVFSAMEFFARKPKNLSLQSDQGLWAWLLRQKIRIPEKVILN